MKHNIDMNGIRFGLIDAIECNAETLMKTCPHVVKCEECIMFNINTHKCLYKEIYDKARQIEDIMHI